MFTRLKNLWAWSAIDPYVLGAETGRALIEAIKQPGEIIYPNTTREEFMATPSESVSPEELEELLTKE